MSDKRVEIGRIADLRVEVRGDSPFHVWVERVQDGAQKDPTQVALEPAEAIMLAELLLTASRTPVGIGNPDRTLLHARLWTNSNPPLD